MEIIALIWGILCLILFFKIWGMCNDIKRLTDKYAPKGQISKLGKETLETRDDIDKWLGLKQ